MNEKEIVIKSVEYDVSFGKLKKQPDLELAVQFCEENKHKNLCIEYETNEDAQRRRMTLRKWVLSSEYANKYYLRVRGNKIYVIRESEE